MIGILQRIMHIEDDPSIQPMRCEECERNACEECGEVCPADEIVRGDAEEWQVCTACLPSVVWSDDEERAEQRA